MTTDERELLTVTHVLNVCDRLLGEPARRRHLFAWLRPQSAAADEWLPVDGYYPANKLVVVCHSAPDPNDYLYSQLVPAHGFRLLELTPGDLGGEPARAEARIRARIAALGPAPRRAREAQPRESAVSRAVWSLAPERRVAETRAGARTPDRDDRSAVSPRPTIHARRSAEMSPLGAGFGALLGVVLAAALLGELYVGVVVVGFNDGQPLLAIALALDACARALGTIAAGHAGLRDWAWWCAIGGSPVVALFAMFERREPGLAEPAPLAGVISLLAMGLAVLGGLVALAGGG
jgi:hypothetical protein